MSEVLVQKFVETVRSTWGGLSTETVSSCHAALRALAREPELMPWLEERLQRSLDDGPLYVDPEHGFRLLAHTEEEGYSFAPHDHGRGWVIYAVAQGAMQIRTYCKAPHGLVRREDYIIRDGECRVFLPGDIHDTRCTSERVYMLRLTSCDLAQELQAERMTRYPAVDDYAAQGDA